MSGRTSLRSLRRLLALALLAGLLASVAAQATPRSLKAFKARYPAAADSLGRCGTCHNADVPELNHYGTALKIAGLDFAKTDSLDSDHDGAINVEEIKLLTLPGDSLSVPPKKSAVKDTAKAKPVPKK